MPRPSGVSFSRTFTVLTEYCTIIIILVQDANIAAFALVAVLLSSPRLTELHTYYKCYLKEKKGERIFRIFTIPIEDCYTIIIFIE